MKLPIAIVLALSIATMAGCGGGSGGGDGSGESEPQNPPPVTRAFDMGFTTWPYDATVTAVNFVYTETSARGDFVAHHLDGLAGNWGAGTNEQLLAPWDARDFDSPEVIQAYTAFATDMITRFQPTYFNLGIEASELLVNDLTRFNRYVTFATQVTNTLRADFPDLRLMISVALKSPGSARAQTIEANIDPLIDLVDVVGISVYPYVFFDHADKGDPANLPANWFSQIQNIASGKPIAVAETAWIAERLEVPAFGVDVMANAQNQADYMAELFAEAEALDADFVVWWALVDFDALWSTALAEDPVARIWRDTGLFDESLNPRPALDIWQQQFVLAQ